MKYATPANNKTAPGQAAKWFSPIQLVAKGVSDNQNSRCRMTQHEAAAKDKKQVCFKYFYIFFSAIDCIPAGKHHILLFLVAGSTNFAVSGAESAATGLSVITLRDLTQRGTSRKKEHII